MDLPSDAFYRNRSQRDGLSLYCRRCTVEEQRRRTPQIVANTRRYRAADPSRAVREAARWRAAHPDAAKAYRAVHWALKTGTLVRPAHCGACAQDCKPDAHHADYARPLDVEWLCRRCHGERQRKYVA